MEGFIAAIIVLFIVLIIIFLVTRQFWCWYWKINIRISELEKINENLEQIKGLLIHENAMMNQKTYNSGEDKLPEL